MTPRHDDHDHYPDRKPPVNAQFVGTMFDPEPESERARLEREQTIDARFKLFHKDNPHVYQLLEARALAQLAAGSKRIVIGKLVEDLRADQTIATTADREGFKVNNDFRSRYARMLIEKHPLLARVLPIRALKSE